MRKILNVNKLAPVLGLGLSMAMQAQASLIIDDFGFHPYAPVNNAGFSTVMANQDTPSEFGSSNTGNILGGERDISVEMTDIFGQYAQGRVSNGWFGALNMPMLSVGLDWSGEFAFAIQYDGVDGSASQNANPGLNLNAAQSGDVLQIGYHRQLLNVNAYGDSIWQVSMTDINGQMSSVSQTIVGYQLGGGTKFLDYNFGLFEANNTLFDITNISMIEVSSTVKSFGPGSSWVELTGITIGGNSYTQTNTPGTGTTNPSGPTSSVAEPSTLALFGLALGALGIRRKKSQQLN